MYTIRILVQQLVWSILIDNFRNLEGLIVSILYLNVNTLFKEVIKIVIPQLIHTQYMYMACWVFFMFLFLLTLECSHNGTKIGPDFPTFLICLEEHSWNPKKYLINCWHFLKQNQHADCSNIAELLIMWQYTPTS